MQVSKELLIAEFSKIVSEYESLYARFGDSLVWYNQAVGKINGLGLFFYSDDSDVDAAYEMACEQVGNIYLNGDKDDYSRRKARDEQPDAYELAADAALAKQDIQDEARCVFCDRFLNDGICPSDACKEISSGDSAVTKPSSLVNCVGLTSRDLFKIWTWSPQWIARHRSLTRSVRQKPFRAVRLPLDQNWTGANRYLLNRGLAPIGRVA